MSMVSIIIPTRNRASVLQRCLEALVASLQKTSSPWEILVVDNASTDDTAKVAEKMSGSLPQLRLLPNADPSLHSGRNKGLAESKGEILAYLDDDSFVEAGWFNAIGEVFSDSSVALASGAIRPFYEKAPPAWFDLFWCVCPKGKFMGELSVLDFGEGSFDLPAQFVWGCNFIVRKSAALKVGGFKPDGMPDEFLLYRGTGESALAAQVAASGGRVRYDSRLAIQHLVSEDRSIFQYFLKRSFTQGVSDSYMQTRNFHLPNDCVFSPLESSFVSTPKRNPKDLREKLMLSAIQNSYNCAFLTHQKAAQAFPELMDYILKPDYLNDSAEGRRLLLSEHLLLAAVKPESQQDILRMSLAAHAASAIRDISSLGVPVAFFGAGSFTRRLIEALDKRRIPLPYVIFDDAKAGESIRGIDVVKPDKRALAAGSAIVLGTDFYFFEFRSRCEEAFGPSCRLIDFKAYLQDGL